MRKYPQMQSKCSKMQPKCSQNTAKIKSKCSQKAVKMQSKCSQNPAQMQSKYNRLLTDWKVFSLVLMRCLSFSFVDFSAFFSIQFPSSFVHKRKPAFFVALFLQIRLQHIYSELSGLLSNGRANIWFLFLSVYCNILGIKLKNLIF